MWQSLLYFILVLVFDSKIEALVKPIPDAEFNPKEDAEKLEELFGNDLKEEEFKEFILSRSCQQRSEIQNIYNEEHQLTIDEKSEEKYKYSYKFLVISCFECDGNLLALHLELEARIMTIPDTKDTTEILVSASESKQIHDVFVDYFKTHWKSDPHHMIKKIVDKGPFRDVLDELAKRTREDPGPVDQKKAEDTANDLHNEVDKWEHHHRQVLDHVTMDLHFEQARLVFDQFEKVHEAKIEDVIEKKFQAHHNADIRRVYRYLVEFIRDKDNYTVNRIYDAVHGVGTRDLMLMRLILLHTETDIKHLTQVYKQRKKMSLRQRVKEDVSGSYGHLLLEFLPDDNNEEPTGQHPSEESGADSKESPAGTCNDASESHHIPGDRC